MIAHTPLCLLGLLGLTLFASPVAAQVFDSGPSDSALFDNVVNIPSDPNIGNFQSIGGDGSTVQVNVTRGGAVGVSFDTNSGSELNINGGFLQSGFEANSGSEVNISAGIVGSFFDANPGSRINLFGTDFAINGMSLDNELTICGTLTIVDRDVTLSGRMADGRAFSFELNSVNNDNSDFFAPTATLTVTLIPQMTFDGDSAGEEFGGSVSGAGDVNGDGFDDLIVGAEFDNNNGEDSGSARVISGIDGSTLYNLNGDSANDQFGTSVSGAGDVNGDGFADLIVGARFDDNNGTDSGSARVISGVDGSILYNFDGDSAFASFGTSVSGAGDVNDDGFADLIVGASLGENNGILSGSAWVFSGVDGSVLHRFAGDSSSDLFGECVSGAGDVNGDGFADLIVGAVGDDNNGDRSGSARVFSGSDGSVLYNFDGSSTRNLLGRSVSGAGDVNDDGFADLIVGAIGDGDDNFFNGTTRVYSGSDGSVLHTFGGDPNSSNFGISVSSAGDVNGDGVADVMVGADRGGANDGGYARVFISKIPATVILGDCNLDGEVTFADIPVFISILSNGTFLAQADCNQDGEVTFADIPPFIAILVAN